MGFIKNALGMIGDAATGGLASGVGSFVSGIFGGGGIRYNDQKKLMEQQHGYELENMDYQAKLNEEMAQRNQPPKRILRNDSRIQYSEKSEAAIRRCRVKPCTNVRKRGKWWSRTGSTGGASGSGVGLSQAQAVSMGLQLEQTS